MTIYNAYFLLTKKQSDLIFPISRREDFIILFEKIEEEFDFLKKLGGVECREQDRRKREDL